MRYAVHLLAAAGAVLAAATAVQAAGPLDEATVRSRLAGVEVVPSKKEGWLTIKTWREPEIRLTDSGFELVLLWNGLDDERWPATRIAEVLAAEICGRVRTGSLDRHLDRLYGSRSLVAGVDLGGNAGVTFRKQLAGSLGACRLELIAEGARWHTLTMAVRK